jgi:Outer membrane protein beta-barrel domain
MRRLIIGLLVFGSCVTAPVPVLAQERVPHKGSTAVGIDVGVLAPTSDQLDKSLLVNALYEYYVTPRVSLRTEFGWANPEFKGAGIDSLRQAPLRMDINYNWERGRWHPFVGTGVGAYFMQFRNNGQSFGQAETKLGLNSGGGMEYFLNRNVAVKAEGRYHAIANARGQEPSGVTLTAGLKTYF